MYVPGTGTVGTSSLLVPGTVGCRVLVSPHAHRPPDPTGMHDDDSPRQRGVRVDT